VNYSLEFGRDPQDLTMTLTGAVDAPSIRHRAYVGGSKSQREVFRSREAATDRLERIR